MRASEAAAVWETLRAKRAAGVDSKEHQRQQRKPAAMAPAAPENHCVVRRRYSAMDAPSTGNRRSKTREASN
jgi:hypothetical protein